MAKHATPAKHKPKKKQSVAKPSDQPSTQVATRNAAKISHQLLEEVVETLWLPDGLSEEEARRRVEAAAALLKDMKPRDSVEKLLGAQMISVHAAAMDCLRRAMIPEQTLEGRDSNLRHATKLLAIYEKQLAALDKHRGKGQQRVTVEHVQVQAGGQAIVGTVEQKGEG